MAAQNGPRGTCPQEVRRVPKDTPVL